MSDRTVCLASFIFGVFRALGCGPLLTYLYVRCAAVLADHPELPTNIKDYTIA